MDRNEKAFFENLVIPKGDVQMYWKIKDIQKWNYVKLKIRLKQQQNVSSKV